MFSYKKQCILPIILVQCECGREFIQEEMYCCLTCSVSICRYCLTNEIFCYSCRNCQEIQLITNDNLNNINVNCNSCFECPVCRNVLRKTLDQDKLQNIQYIFIRYSFQCSYCFYSTKSIQIADQDIKQVYNKINALHRKENEEFIADCQQQVQRIKTQEAAILLTKKNHKKQHLLRSLTQTSRSDTIIRMHSVDIEKQQKDKNIKIDFERANLIINPKKSVELCNFTGENPKKQTLIPIPLAQIGRKNRKCRKCQKIIIQIQLEKPSSKRIAPTVQALHYDYAPMISIAKMKYLNKDKADLIVQLQMINKTKFQLEFKLLPINQQIIDSYKLLTVKNLPSEIFVLSDIIETDHLNTQGAIFDAIIQLIPQAKIQFAIVVECQIKMPKEIMKFNYNLNVYIG